MQWAQISRPVIEALRQCRVISRYGIGVDMIDLEAATEHGIPVCNVPDFCIDEVSTHTLAFVLALNRHLFAHHTHVMGGQWGGYWYNGFVIGSEIARGLDLLRLKPGPRLSKNEIEAAESARVEQYNPQHQEPFAWPASFAVARSYLDQLVRNKGLAPAKTSRIATGLARAEKLGGADRRAALERLASEIGQDAGRAADAGRVKKLAGAVADLAKV